MDPRWLRRISGIAYRLGAVRAMESIGWVIREYERRYSECGSGGIFIVLVFHRVGPVTPETLLTPTPPELFEEWMRWFSHEFDILSLGEIADRLEGGQLLPNRCLAITFDDGFRDNYIHAYPILKRNRIPATIFLTTGPIDDGGDLWFEQVFDAIDQSKQPRFRFDVTGETFRLFDDPLAKRRVAERVLSVLMNMEERRRKEATNILISLLGGSSSRGEDRSMLSWEEIREMSRGGMEFGSHTVTHPVLTRVSPEQLRSELLHSKQRIEREIGRTPRVFAYPVGKAEHFSPAVVDALRDSGYSMAFTTIPRVNRAEDDPYVFGRIPIWEKHLPTIALRLGILRLRCSWKIRTSQ